MTKALSPAISLLILSLGGIALGLAWLLPHTILSALLGFTALFALLLPLQNKSNSYLGYFLFGMTANASAFYWLIPTISDFGGYPQTISIALYALFAFYHAGLYLLFLFLFRKLTSRFPSFPIICAFGAWSTAKYIYPEIFPWHFSHTIIELRSLVQVVDLGGSMLATGVMFLIVAIVFQIINYEFKSRTFLINVLILLATLIYGMIRTNHFDLLPATEKKISIVQSEVSIQKSQGVSYLAADPNRYLALSEALVPTNQPDLIIWPETVIVRPVPSNIRSVNESASIPYIENTNLITGSLSFTNEDIHNSAFAILASGDILPPYHKQILMPFGEFMPLAETFPFLADLNPNFAPITPGNEIRIFNLANGIKAVPLICYEDLTPAISREASAQGGNILVNISNDAWFGKSAAALQHNLIASFRAIENRRFLARATNSGLSAVIDPTGQVVAQIPLFTEGLINTKIKLIEERTIFTNFYGSYFWLMVVIISLLMLVCRKAQK